LLQKLHSTIAIFLDPSTPLLTLDRSLQEYIQCIDYSNIPDGSRSTLDEHLVLLKRHILICSVKDIIIDGCVLLSSLNSTAKASSINSNRYNKSAWDALISVRAASALTLIVVSNDHYIPHIMQHKLNCLQECHHMVTSLHLHGHKTTTDNERIEKMKTTSDKAGSDFASLVQIWMEDFPVTSITTTISSESLQQHRDRTMDVVSWDKEKIEHVVMNTNQNENEASVTAVRTCMSFWEETIKISLTQLNEYIIAQSSSHSQGGSVDGGSDFVLDVPFRIPYYMDSISTMEMAHYIHSCSQHFNLPSSLFHHLESFLVPARQALLPIMNSAAITTKCTQYCAQFNHVAELLRLKADVDLIDLIVEGIGTHLSKNRQSWFIVATERYDIYSMHYMDGWVLQMEEDDISSRLDAILDLLHNKKLEALMEDTLLPALQPYTSYFSPSQEMTADSTSNESPFEAWHFPLILVASTLYYQIHLTQTLSTLLMVTQSTRECLLQMCTGSDSERVGCVVIPTDAIEESMAKIHEIFAHLEQHPLSLSASPLVEFVGTLLTLNTLALTQAAHSHSRAFHEVASSLERENARIAEIPLYNAMHDEIRTSVCDSVRELMDSVYRMMDILQYFDHIEAIAKDRGDHSSILEVSSSIFLFQFFSRLCDKDPFCAGLYSPIS
jgi:hypothetical protein